MLLNILFFADWPNLNFERNQVIVLLGMTCLKLTLFSTLKLDYIVCKIYVFLYGLNDSLFGKREI